MDEDDNELTSLNWLHNVSILGTTIVPAVPPGPMTALAMKAAAATQDQKDFQTIRIGINQDDDLSSCSKKGKKKSKKSSSKKVL